MAVTTSGLMILWTILKYSLQLPNTPWSCYLHLSNKMFTMYIFTDINMSQYIGEWLPTFSNVVPTSQVFISENKDIVNMFYCFYKIIAPNSIQPFFIAINWATESPNCHAQPISIVVLTSSTSTNKVLCIFVCARKVYRFRFQ